MLVVVAGQAGTSAVSWRPRSQLIALNPAAGFSLQRGEFGISIGAKPTCSIEVVQQTSRRMIYTAVAPEAVVTV